MKSTNLTLQQVLVSDRVFVLDQPEKSAVLNRLCEVLATAPEVTDVETLRKAIFAREELMSTGIGMGIGVPHVRIPSVKNVVMAVGVSREPIVGYEGLDGGPVHIVCMIAAYQDQHSDYIRTLANVSHLLKHESVRQALLAAEDEASIYRILTEKRN